MKRNLMMTVLLAFLLLMGHFGVTRASKSWPEAENNSSGQFGAQMLREKESIQADKEKSDLGLALSPVPLRPSYGNTRFLVGLGGYLVSTSCSGCHTNPTFAPGGDPFKGEPEKINAANFMAGGRAFGPFTSRNITPNPDVGNLPAGLTFDEFVRTMRTGEDLKNRHPQISPLLQVMPWPEYDKLTDRDLLAIYYYLSHIPHAERATPQP